MEGPEICREYVYTERIWFGASPVYPGKRGEIDPRPTLAFSSKKYLGKVESIEGFDSVIFSDYHSWAVLFDELVNKALGGT